MKRPLLLLLIVLALTIGTSAYRRTGPGHPQITNTAMSVKQTLHSSESCWNNPLFLHGLQSFYKQSAEEDVQSPDLGFWQPWRPFYHFYDPATHDGIVAWGNAVTRMADLQKEARDRLKDVVCALKRHDSGAASEAMRRFMRIMGSIAHIAEDLTTPHDIGGHDILFSCVCCSMPRQVTRHLRNRYAGTP